VKRAAWWECPLCGREFMWGKVLGDGDEDCRLCNDPDAQKWMESVHAGSTSEPEWVRLILDHLPER
jgi:hypothetical protein